MLIYALICYPSSEGYGMGIVGVRRTHYLIDGRALKGANFITKLCLNIYVRFHLL